MEESKRSYSLEELENRRKMSESELKRQLSHDLANDPTFATVFNPPQIFSDEDNKTIVWTNSEPIVSLTFLGIKMIHEQNIMFVVVVSVLMETYL